MRVVEGKVPPNAVDLEQAVIGVCLLFPETFRQLSGILEADHLYSVSNASIWRAMSELSNEGAALDILTVTERCSLKGWLNENLSPFYISQLTNKVSGSANAEYHARVIQQKFIQRSLQTLGSRLQNLDEREDVFDTLDWANDLIAKVNAIPSTKDPRNAAEIMGEIADNTERPVYISLGMGQLDDHVRMGPKNVVVIGARPSVGKTTFAVNACMNMAKAGHKVLFISLEMSEVELTAKIAGALTGIDTERITRGDLNASDRERIARVMVECGVWLPRIMIEDLATLKGGQIAGLIHRAVERHGVEVVVIDYLQCIQGEGDSPVDRMTNISRACKSAAKSTGVRLIELSQLKRRDGADVDPQMSDLREAGQIEADGDIIVMLGREKGSNVLRANVAKNKVGPIGAVEIPFDLTSQRIGGTAPDFLQYNPRAGIVPHPDNRIDDSETAPF